jgi:hypothetical protein
LYRRILCISKYSYSAILNRGIGSFGEAFPTERYTTLIHEGSSKNCSYTPLTAVLFSGMHRHYIHSSICPLSSFLRGVRPNPRASAKSSYLLAAINGRDTFQNSVSDGGKSDVDTVVSVSDYMSALKDISEKFLDQVWHKSTICFLP